jgi:hypothetical protein
LKVSQALAALARDDSEKNRLAAAETEAKLAAWHESARITNPDYASVSYPQPYTPGAGATAGAEAGTRNLPVCAGGAAIAPLGDYRLGDPDDPAAAARPD